jgi:transcriptional regulator with XRE-family HTH domain
VGNERLRDAMRVAHVSEAQLARQVGVDPKTVGRWLAEGRVPRDYHRRAVAEALHVNPSALWPVDDPAQSDSSSEVIAAYAHRADVQAHAWRAMFLSATSQIDLLGYALLFLPESFPALTELLCDKAQAGVAVRICFVDPTCDNARLRDQEEGLDDGLLARIRTSMRYFRGVADSAGIEVRCHTAPMYNSTFRWDDDMFVTPHLYGLPGYHAPLFHLQRRIDGGVFDNFARNIDAHWASTREIEWPP